MIRGRTLAIAIGLGLTFLLTLLFYLDTPFIAKPSRFLDDALYDFRVKYAHTPLRKETPITLVYIDDKSLVEEGRWPWPRGKIGELVEKLYENGAKVIAIDSLFAEEEYGDQDELFASSLAKGDSVLAYTLNNSDFNEGFLPPPLIKNTHLPFTIHFTHYLANIAVLQQAAKAGGFINAIPDSDGVFRFTPLLLEYQNGLYPSLGLNAAIEYLKPKKIAPITADYQNGTGLEGLQLDDFVVPLTVEGTALIPFRGGPGSFPHVSAVKVLKGEVEKELIANRLIFIGPEGTGLGDLFATAIAPIFSGMEIHATIAAGVLDRYFPYSPTWSKGVAVVLVFFLGILIAILLPFFGAFLQTICFAATFAFVILFDAWMWKNEMLVLSILPPLFTLFCLYLFNLIFGYAFETRKKEAIKEMFGHYLPPAYLNQMLQTGQEYNLQGETKNLTVFFADIRNFTDFAEKLRADELKSFLNDYFTKITKIIFDYRGTIDKYEGDLVMAFWGAPIADIDHALHAVEAALAIQAKIKELNLPLALGIGINTGLMNVGDMGSSFRVAYTVIGDSVNFSSRLENLTKFYALPILIGEASRQEIGERLLFKMVDRVKVKGKTQSIRIYQPVGKPGSLSPEEEKLRLSHEEGFAAYLKQDWDTAERLFVALAPTNPTLYTIYRERIAAFRKSPPPQDWDGSVSFSNQILNLERVSRSSVCSVISVFISVLNNLESSSIRDFLNTEINTEITEHTEKN